MSFASNQLKTEIVYPDSDGKPMAESDPARDYLIYVKQVANTLSLSVDEVRSFAQ
jgi:hypothetical protein